MSVDPERHVTAERPRADDPEGWYALGVIQALLPTLGYLEHAPRRLQLKAKIAMSWQLWTVLRFMRFGQINPVDPLGQKVFGFDIEIQDDWPLERIEIVLPIVPVVLGQPL